jgi:hypothetical protein
MDLRNHLRFAVLTLVVALVASTAAFAGHGGPPPPPPPPPQHGPPPPQPGKPAPEVDPSLALAGISFLAGTLAVVRSRFRK